MITSENPFHNPSYDPLALQFMTGGQMGYMPNAQYLTPPEYGAFRSMPSPHQGIMPRQQPSLWQSYMISNRGSPFGMLPDYSLSNYQMGVDQSMYRTMGRRRMQDAGGAFGATAANMGINAGVSATLGMGSPFATLGISAALPDFGAPMTDRIAQQRRIQDMTMSRISMGSDVAGGLGQGFSAPAASRIDDSIRRRSASDVLFKEEDYREIMRTGVENGLFDYANSSQEYKRNIKKLRDNINVMSEIIGSTDFKELSESMKRLMSMGADLNQMSDISHMERMFSRMTGMRQDQMVSAFGQQGALTFSQLGLTNYQGSMAAMSHAAGTTMAQRLGLLDPGTVARHGGVSGMVQNLTQQQGMSMRKTQDFYLPMLANGDFTGLNGDSSKIIEGLMSGDMGILDTARGASRIGSAAGMASYEGNRANLMQKLIDKIGPTGFNLMERQLAMGLGQQMGGEGAQDSLTMGYRLMGYDDEMAMNQAKQWSDPEFVEAQRANVATERRRQRFSALEQRRHKESAWNKAAVWGREFGQLVANPFRAWSENWATRSQRKEDQELGYLTTYGPGPSRAGGAGGMSDAYYNMVYDGQSVDERMDKWAGKLPSQAEEDYMLGGGSINDPQLEGPEGERLRKRGQMLRRIARDPMKRSASTKYFKQFGDDFSIQSLVGEMGESKWLGGLRGSTGSITDMDSFTREHVVAQVEAAITNSIDPRGKSEDQVRKLRAQAKSRAEEIVTPEFMHAYGSELKAQSDTFADNYAKQFSERAVLSESKKYETLGDMNASLSDRLKNVVDSGGLFGLHSKDDREYLANAMEENVYTMDATSLQMLHSAYFQASSAGKQEEADRAKKKFIKKARALGFTESEAKIILDNPQGMRSKLARKILKERGMSDERINKLTGIADASTDDAGSSSEMIARSDELDAIKDDRLKFDAYNRREQMTGALKRHDMSLDELKAMEDNELKDLLGSDKVKDDPALQATISSLMQAREAGGKVTMDSLATRHGVGNFGDLIPDTETLTGDASKSGDESSAGTLDTTIESLDKVLQQLATGLSGLSRNLSGNTDVLRRVLNSDALGN